jgi:ABC-2 type transport system permease protein
MRWWTIAKSDLRINFRDRMFFFWLLLFPLLFAFVFGMAFRGSSEGDQRISLDIINRDTGLLSQALLGEIKHEKYDITLKDEIDEETIRALIIPGTFTADILAGRQVELLLKQKENRNLEAGQSAYSLILKGIIKILARVVQTAPEDQADLEARFGETELERLVILKTEIAGQAREAPSGFTHSIPGTMVMFLLFTVLMYGGIGILQERRQGILSRLSASPATFVDIIAGKWISRVILGLMQITILLLAGWLLFKVNPGGSLPGLFLIALFFSASIAGLSIFLGSLFRREEALIIVNILAANFMAALGGCWWPLEIVPKTIRTMGYLLPTGWTMDAFHKMIFFGRGLSSVLVNIAALGGFTLFFLVLAVKFFRIRSV